MKTIILLLTLVKLCFSLKVTLLCYENCDSKEQSYINPTKPIVLFAACSGTGCENVKYTWSLIRNPKNTKQSFEANDVTGISENKLTINADILPQGEQYIVQLEVELRPGRISKTSLKLNMDKCSKKFPCNEKPSTISPEYLGDNSYEEYVATMPPELLKKSAENDLDTLKSLDKKSPAFKEKRTELLLKLKHLPVRNQTEIKYCSEITKRVVRETSSTPFEPKAAKLVSQISRKLSKARLDLVKKTKNPKDMTEDVKKTTEEVLSHTKVTVNVTRDQLTDHREAKQEIKENITFEAPFTESYPIYDDFDVEFQGKQKNIETIAEETVKTIDNLADANLRTMANRTNEQQYISDDICMLNILDAPNNVKDKKYLICDVTFYISPNLAKELSQKMKTSAFSFAVVKKNLFWWNTPNGTAFVAYIEIEDFQTKRNVINLKSPIQFSTKTDHKETQVVNGTFKIPINHSMNDIRDEDISVFQLIPKKEIQVLMVQFENLGASDKIKVVILKNQRPQLEDFLNPVIIPKSDSEADKFIIIKRIKIPIGNFGYVGVLPTTETMENSGSDMNDYRYFNYSVKFTRLSCDVWNDYYLDWQSQHCQVGRNTTVQEIYCSCYHTSIFATTSYNIESRAIEDWEIPIFLTREYNFVVLITIILVLFVFGVALLFVVWRQRKFQKQKKVLFLLDNNLNGRYEYLICVYTGTQKLSGTTANIGIKIYGSLADTDRHILRSHFEPVLQQGYEDWFYLMTPVNLGKLRQIDLWTDCNGLRMSWFCTKIVIHGLHQERKWIFEVNQWFSVLNDNISNTISGSLKETSIPMTNWDFAKLGMKDHLWITPFKNLGITPFTYLDRMFVILSIVLVNMLFAMIFLGIPYPGLYGQFGRGHFCFEGVEFGMAFGVALVSFGITYGLIYLFEASKPISESNMKMIKFDSTPIKITLFMVIVISLVILIPFGLWFNYISSLVWLPIFIVAVMLCILFELVRVALTAAILKRTNIIAVHAKLDMSEIEPQKELILKQYGEMGLRPFFQKFYHLISEIDMKLKKEKELQQIELRTIIVDIIMFSIYLIILFSVVLLNKDPMSNKFSQTIENVFIQDKFIRKVEFNEINSEKRLYRYLRQVFFPAVSTTTWYPNYTSSEEGLVADFSTKMLGVPRVRQLRVVADSCSVHSALSLASDGRPCHATLTAFNQDTASYSPRWTPSKNISSGATGAKSRQVWWYQSWKQSETGSTIGELNTYPAGGYITNFGRTLENSLLILQYIESLKWIDERTRVLFFEVYFYNANQNLFSLLTLIVEVSATGKYITNHQDELAIGIFVTFLLLITMILVFIWRKYKQLRNTVFSQFMTNLWNIIDIFIILISFVFIMVYFLRSVAVANLIKTLEESANNEFISFNNALYWDDCVIILATMLVTISTVRLWKLLRFLRMFRICEVTLILAAKYLLAVAFITFIVIFAYSTFGYIVFGPYSANFRTVSQSFISLLIHSFGFKLDFNYDVFESTYCYIGYIYYVIFMIILIFIINIFIAIIVVAYESSKVYFDETDKEKLVSYNIINFLNDEYKYYRSKNKGRDMTFHLRGGEENIKIDELKDVEPKRDVARKEVRINSDRANSMHIISENILNILIKRFADKKNIHISHYDDLISETLSNILNEKADIKQDEENVELFVVIPEDYSYKYISKQKLLDMYCIVEYLFRSKESGSHPGIPTSSIDKQAAIIISMNLIVKEMIQKLENLANKMFMDKSTNVTFKDLGLIIVEFKENDENRRKTKN